MSINIFSAPIGGQPRSLEVIHQAEGGVDQENQNVQNSKGFQSKF